MATTHCCPIQSRNYSSWLEMLTLITINMLISRKSLNIIPVNITSFLLTLPVLQYSFDYRELQGTSQRSCVGDKVIISR